MTPNFCLILTTTGNREEAEHIADMLVSRRLAACVQITSISSVYLWKGQINHDAEFLLLIKTAARLYSEVEAAIVANHSYEVPEVVQVPIDRGLDSYLGWIDKNSTNHP